MKNKNPTTTVSVDATTRDIINDMAEDLNLSQREMVTRLVETYRWAVTDEAFSGAGPPEDALAKIEESLEKVLKRDDRIVAFIKEQEKVLLKPILQTVQATDANLQQLVSILSNLE